MAWPTAAAESEPKQPWMPQTLYSMTHAPGARPWMAGSRPPRIDTFGSMLPPAVEAVWVPWPLESRAVWNGSAAARAGSDRYVARNGAPPISLCWQTNGPVGGVSGVSPNGRARAGPGGGG